jgi:hypothetical protein
MVDTASKSVRFSLRPTIYAGAIALVVFPTILVLSFDLGEILYITALLPAVTLILLVFAVGAAIRRRWRRCLSILLIVALFLAISSIVLRNDKLIHLQGLWLLHSRSCKAQPLAEPAPANGELRHVEWGGWGMFGQDTNVYLVFDPSDSLAVAARKGRPGKFPGIPCEAPRVLRLEPHWYATLFYTDSAWGQCS